MVITLESIVYNKSLALFFFFFSLWLKVNLFHADYQIIR